MARLFGSSLDSIAQQRQQELGRASGGIQNSLRALLGTLESQANREARQAQFKSEQGRLSEQFKAEQNRLQSRENLRRQDRQAQIDREIARQSVEDNRRTQERQASERDRLFGEIFRSVRSGDISPEELTGLEGGFSPNQALALGAARSSFEQEQAELDAEDELIRQTFEEQFAAQAAPLSARLEDIETELEGGDFGRFTDIFLPGTPGADKARAALEQERQQLQTDLANLRTTAQTQALRQGVVLDPLGGAAPGGAGEPIIDDGSLPPPPQSAQELPSLDEGPLGFRDSAPAEPELPRTTSDNPLRGQRVTGDELDQRPATNAAGQRLTISVAGQKLVLTEGDRRFFNRVKQDALNRGLAPADAEELAFSRLVNQMSAEIGGGRSLGGSESFVPPLAGL